MLNLGSLLLGITAWVVPFLAMKHPPKKSFIFIIFSFSACIESLCLQIFDINNRVQIEVWSSLMDTIGALIWVVVILSIIANIHNIIALVLCTKNEIKI